MTRSLKTISGLTFAAILLASLSVHADNTLDAKNTTPRVETDVLSQELIKEVDITAEKHRQRAITLSSCMQRAFQYKVLHRMMERDLSANASDPRKTDLLSMLTIEVLRIALLGVESADNEPNDLGWAAPFVSWEDHLSDSSLATRTASDAKRHLEHMSRFADKNESLLEICQSFNKNFPHILTEIDVAGGTYDLWEIYGSRSLAWFMFAPEHGSANFIWTQKVEDITASAMSRFGILIDKFDDEFNKIVKTDYLHPVATDTDGDD